MSTDDVIAEESDVPRAASHKLMVTTSKNLENCACKIVQYCSVACQTEHRSEHKRACKKRVAELRDEILFKQPESSCFGDCPICCLPISIDKNNLG